MKNEKRNENKNKNKNVLSNIIFYYNRLKNKILNFEPEILKEKFEGSYLYELNSIEDKLDYLKKNLILVLLKMKK